MSYGQSIKLNSYNDFEFDPNTKSILFVEEEDNLIQIVKNSLKTLQGEYAFFPDFGIDYQLFIKKNISADNIKHAIKFALLRDSRIKRVNRIIIERVSRDTLYIFINIVTTQNTSLEISEDITW